VNFSKKRFLVSKTHHSFLPVARIKHYANWKKCLGFYREGDLFCGHQKKKKETLTQRKKYTNPALDDESVLVFENEKITRLFPKSEVMIELPFVAEQEHIIKCNANTLRYSTTAAGITTFFEYDIRKEITRILTSAKINQDFSLQCGKNANEIRIDFSESSDQIIRLQ
jgi:hypothetical protein